MTFDFRAPPKPFTDSALGPGSNVLVEPDDNTLNLVYEDPLPLIKALNNLPTEEELLHVYKRTRFLLDNAEKLEPNHAIQVSKACSTILTGIARAKESIYNQQRIKIMEETLIKTLKQYPQLSDAFLATYEQALDDANLDQTT